MEHIHDDVTDGCKLLLHRPSLRLKLQSKHALMQTLYVELIIIHIGVVDRCDH